MKYGNRESFPALFHLLEPTWSNCKHATFLIFATDESGSTMCSLDTGEWIGLNTEWTALLISRASTNKPENVPLVSLSAPSLIRGDEGSTCHSRPWYHDVSNLFTLVSHFSSGYVTSLLHQGPSIPQRYSCVKGAFSLRLPVAGVKGIQILKTK